MPDQLTVEPVYTCSECGAAYSEEYEASDCCAVHSCDHCGSEFSDPDDAYYCCRYTCSSCGSEYRYSDEAENCCRYMCHECGDWHDYEEDAIECCGTSYRGDLPYLPAINAHEVSVPELPARPARLCSLEQELSSGGSAVAALLYEQGLSEYRELRSYHSSGGGRRTIHVEQDGSLGSDGGEVVYDRFDLSDEGDVAIMSRALGKIRQLRDHNPGNRIVRTGFDAGIHVHISAKAEDGSCMSPRDMAALHELWTYAEDMLYSLSAAGWNRHRQPTDTGPYASGYCKAVPKVEGEATPAKVWRAMRSDRYYGLNFQRLFQASQSCSCGAAQMGDWPECECSAMDRATVEFRVFNTSTLPRTIHAFLVLSHALVAHAMRHELGTLEVNEYGTQTASEKRMVLDHLLRVLPLTEGEIGLIEDAARRAPGLS